MARKLSFNKVKKFMKTNSYYIAVAIISILILLLGWQTIGVVRAILIVGSLLFIMFIIEFFTKKKKRKSRVTTESVSNTTTTKKKKKKRKIWKIILLILLILAIAAVIAAVGFCFYIASSAPAFDPNAMDRKEASLVYDSEGNTLASLGKESRQKISYDEISETLINAIIATEDSRFFQHNGFDLPRFLVASSKQLLGQGGGGASTITMQISKNSYTSTTASGWEGIKRKFTDIYMAIFKIEKNYTKQQILEFYINDSYLGGGAYGVEQACINYFGKSAKDINVAEAALIAGLFQAPGAYDPFIEPEKAEARRKQVLYLMERHGYISSEEAQIARDMTVDKLIVSQASSSNEYQGFINTVISEVVKKTGNDPYEVPMEIYTTMIPEKQDIINKLYDEYKFVDEAVQAGIAVTDVKTGEIVAIGAGRNIVARGLNQATDPRRQIGSTAKPLYEYGPGIEHNGWSTYTPFIDEPHTYSDDTNIKNYDGQFKGMVTLRYAIEDSRNIPALKAFQSIGNSKIKSFVTSLGLNPELEGNIVHEAHAIGGYTGESALTVTAAYAAFANGGYYIEPYSVSKIVYRETGDVYEHKPVKKQVMSEETAYMVTDVLLSTTQKSLKSYMSLSNLNLATKTGTTNYDAATIKANKLPSNAINDLWLTGYTPNYAMTVWYGYERIYADHPDWVTQYGSKEHRKIYSTLAKEMFERDGAKFKKPSDVVEVKIESGTMPGLLPSEFTPKELIVTELFKEGTEPTEVSKRFSALDNVTNLQANLSGNKVIVSWDPIATPDAIDEEKLTAQFTTWWKDEKERDKYLQERITYNNEHIGTITYDIYIKNSDGSLQLLGTTADTTIEHTITSTSNPITYVVKTSYTIFKDNQSTGAEHTIDFGDSSIVNISLNGEQNIKVEQGKAYIEITPSVIVLDNLVNVTGDATVTTVIKDSNNNTVGSVDSTTVGSKYTITYTVSYKDYNETLTRTVEIIESSTPPPGPDIDDSNNESDTGITE